MGLEGKFDSRKGKGIVKIDQERCKGCGLCIVVCPKNSLEVAEKSNEIGYFPAQTKKDYDCSGCTNCAIICPDAAIEIYKED